MEDNRNPSNTLCRRRHPRVLAALGLLGLLPVTGCDGHRSELVESGAVLLSVGTIPEGVACVRVTAAGELRQSVTDFDVAPGATLSEAMSGLPVGKVLFSANAYSQDCASATKSTVPVWLSDEKAVNVTQGKSSSVTLTLYKNGRAKVTVEFGDQIDAGTDAGTRPDGGL